MNLIFETDEENIASTVFIPQDEEKLLLSLSDSVTLVEHSSIQTQTGITSRWTWWKRKSEENHLQISTALTVCCRDNFSKIWIEDFNGTPKSTCFHEEGPFRQRQICRNQSVYTGKFLKFSDCKPHAVIIFSQNELAEQVRKINQTEKWFWVMQNAWRSTLDKRTTCTEDIEKSQIECTEQVRILNQQNFLLIGIHNAQISILDKRIICREDRKKIDIIRNCRLTRRAVRSFSRL